MSKKARRERAAAAAKRIDDVELDRLWRLALQGEPVYRERVFTDGAPKVEVNGKGTPWRRTSSWLFGKEDSDE